MSVDLRWISELNPNGYRLTITSPTPNADDPDSVFISGEERVYTIVDLDPGTEYNFLLEAYVNVSGTPSYGSGENVTQRTSKTAYCYFHILSLAT